MTLQNVLAYLRRY